MSVSPTYPGVYVEEIPSGVRTITGVATSITAFFGRALRGPVNVATTINNYGDFERIFGGLWVDNDLGYAVRDFYLNGGSQAVIVRLFHPDQNVASTSAVVAGKVTLVAASEGKWGANLRAVVDTNVSADVAASMGLTTGDLFNLTVRDSAPNGATETFLNVTYKNSSRRVDKVLADGSNLVRWDTTTLDLSLQKNLPAVAAASDDVTEAETALNTAKRAIPQVPATIAAAQATLDAAQKAVNDAVSNGTWLTLADDFLPNGAEANKLGLYALEQLFSVDGLFNILCIPPYLQSGDVDPQLIGEAAAYCEKHRAMLLVDPPSAWTDKTKAKAGFAAGVGATSANAAAFFPRLMYPNPKRGNQVETFVPSGAVAGIFARTDTQRGVWKAPAGLDATLLGVQQLSVPLSDDENGQLNPIGLNCLRAFPIAGRVVWGSRTLRGADQLADQWKYIPVRRTALYIEESLYRGLQWVVFEPNDEPLWAQIRLNAGAFMHNLFTKGAFQGSTPKDAYFVKCDKETTTQNDIDLGIVNIVVGFAPLKPAEFVIIKLQQMAGQIQA